jgi:O-Antigen ligase
VGFLLFILVSGVLFIRPTDFIPLLEAVRLYAILIVGCILLYWNRLITQVSVPSLRERPVAVCMFGMLLISVLSNLARMDIDAAFGFGVEFAKVIVYFLLLVGVVDSPGRLQRFLACIVAIDLIPIILALLHYHGMIDIPAFHALNDTDSSRFDPETGEATVIRRLKGSGAFGDPNDVCEILNPAMLFSLYGLMNPRRGWVRFLWLAPMVVFGHALSLTFSRGGFIGFLVGLMVLFWARYGRRKSILLAGVIFPVIFVLFGGRQTSISTGEGTGQSRIQIWVEGFDLMRPSPIFGIGTDQFVENVGHVAHNSFIHAYTELGFFGGTFYLGGFYYALRMLGRLGSPHVTIRDPEIRRVRPFILAAVVSYAASELSLTHPYDLSTYTMLGLATVCIRLADPEPPLPGSRLDGRLVLRVVGASALFLVALYVYAQWSVRWG